MNIAIVGYGKMGHMIKNAAERLGHRIVLTADPAASDADVKPASAEDTARAVKSSGAEGVIEFSRPSQIRAALYSIRRIFPSASICFTKSSPKPPAL